MGTEEGFGWWKFDQDFGSLAEELTNFGAVLFGGAGGESVVAHAHEAFGQNMKAPSSNEFVGMEFEDACFSGGAICPFEEDVALGVVA